MEKEAMKEQREAEEDLAIFMNQRLVKEVHVPMHLFFSGAEERTDRVFA